MTPELRTAYPIVACLAVSLVACGGGEDASDSGVWTAVRDTLGDTVVVRTVSGSVWGDTAVLEPRFSIGELEGPDHAIFGSVSALGAGPDGTLFVLDQQAPALRLYGPDGRYLETWGRQGEGPGEYLRPRALSVRADGRILVRDPGAGRITVYGPGGHVEDTWPIRGNFSTGRPLYLDRRDNAYHLILLNPRAPVSEWRYGLVRIAPDGAFGDTLQPPAIDYEPPSVEARGPDSWSRVPVPFSPSSEWHFSPAGYFVFGLSTRYAIELRKPNGTLRVEKEHEPVEVARGEAAEERDRITRNFRDDYGPWEWNGPAIPEHKPPFRDFWVDDDGRIWVLVSRPGVEVANPTYDPDADVSTPTVWEEPPAFDVFDERGRFLGHVKVPPGFTTSPRPVARGDDVWATVRDELDVQRVVRFRLRRGDATVASDR